MWHRLCKNILSLWHHVEKSLWGNINVIAPYFTEINEKWWIKPGWALPETIEWMRETFLSIGPGSVELTTQRTTVSNGTSGTVRAPFYADVFSPNRRLTVQFPNIHIRYDRDYRSPQEASTLLLYSHTWRGVALVRNKILRHKIHKFLRTSLQVPILDTPLLKCCANLIILNIDWNQEVSSGFRF